METTVKNIKEFKISNNIENIYNSTFNILISKLNELEIDYWIGGGFALSLFLAPRQPWSNYNETTTYTINKAYYGDIDFFFKTELDYWKARYCLATLSTTVYENENQVTYYYNGNNIQLVKYNFATPDILMEDFDLVNCSVFIDKHMNVITHPEFYKTILKKEIKMNKFKFNEIQDLNEFKNYSLIISSRLHKYATRYEWSLESNTKNYIQAVVNYLPNIKHSETKVIYSGSSSYTSQKDKNIWEAITPYGIQIPS